MNIFGEIGKLQYSVLEFAMCVLSYPFFHLDSLCSSRKYPYSLYRRDWNFLGGRGCCIRLTNNI